MKSLTKKISWLVASTMILLTAIAYICPMPMHDNSTVMSSLPSLCESAGPASINMNGVINCLDTHLSSIGQFLGSIPNGINALLVLTLLTIVYHLLSRNFLGAMIQPLLNRFKRRYVYYRTSIKLRVEKKLLQYLNFLRNYTIVSIA